MSSPQAVIFDLDDTLYPESQYVTSGFKSVADWAADRWNLPSETVTSQLSSLQKHAQGRVFNAWLDQQGLKNDDANVQEMVKAYRDHSPNIKLLPEVRPVIQLLRKTYRVGLVSDGYKGVQQKKFAALMIADLFDSVVFSDELGREHWKPSRVPFDAVLSKLGVCSDDATYVGDNPQKDFLGARRAGMTSIRLRLTGGVYEHLEPKTSEHEADLEITAWSDLADSIKVVLS